MKRPGPKARPEDANRQTSAELGPTQHWDPERYARNARFVADLGAPLLTLLDAKPGERVLDLGCGDGHLSRTIAASGAEVLAVDASAEQIAAARDAGVEARVADGEKLEFDSEFDAVFSNAALHWMTQADAVVAGVARALKPGGRFVAEMGGAGNVARIVNALVAGFDRRGLDGAAAVPWYFPDADEYGAKLRRHGFTVESCEIIPRMTALPGAMADWLATFAETFTHRLPPAEREAYVAEVVAALAPDLRDSQGNWHADYRRLRFVARKTLSPDGLASPPAAA